jgi:hypothetical protein
VSFVRENEPFCPLLSIYKPIRPSFAESSSPRLQSRFQPPPPNSFPRQPPPREIRHVTDTQQYPTSDDEYLFTVAISQVSDLTTPKAKVQVLIDSGASINVSDEKASSRHQEISAE